MAIIKGDDDDNVLIGTSSADTILGYDGEDLLKGGGGADILDGGTGADMMQGGNGGDTYVVDDFEDEVVEFLGYGEDTIRASINFGLYNAPYVEDLILTGSADLFGYGSGLDNDI